MMNQTNGAITDYKVRIRPQSKIFGKDTFTIKFPPEIQLPTNLGCNMDARSYVLRVNCVQQANQLVQITFVDVDMNH